MRKIILVGANHAGTAAANTILDQYPDCSLTIFERNSNLSYLGCGTALWVGRQIEDENQLFYCSEAVFRGKKATVHMETEVTGVDVKNKCVTAIDKNGKEIQESYDKLILATGSLPITPNVPGVDLDNIQHVKLFQDALAADKRLSDDSIQNIAVVGAGYIGVELAEAVERRGKKALLFESMDRCLSGYYDEWLTSDMDAVLAKNGIDLHYGETITSFEGTGGAVSKLCTDKGEYPVDMVFLAVGFRPNNAILADQLERFDNGSYRVNLKQETNLPDIYAIGDCATVYSNALQETAYIALATNAVRSGIVAAHNACGTDIESVGVQGSNGISVYGYHMVSTGLNMAAAKKAGFDATYTQFEDLQRPAFMKENHPVKLRIVYDQKTRRILGAQVASYEDISALIHMFSLAIGEGVTIDKLKLLDIFFLPHFNQPYNYITMAALSAK